MAGQWHRWSECEPFKSAISECPHKNADYGRHHINREIDPARMPSGDIKLHNLNYPAKSYRPNAQNPRAPCIRQTKQNSDNHECRGVFDIMGRVSRRPKVRRHHSEHQDGQQHRPRSDYNKLLCPIRHQLGTIARSHTKISANKTTAAAAVSQEVFASRVIRRHPCALPLAVVWPTALNARPGGKSHREIIGEMTHIREEAERRLFAAPGG